MILGGVFKLLNFLGWGGELQHLFELKWIHIQDGFFYLIQATYEYTWWLIQGWGTGVFVA